MATRRTSPFPGAVRYVFYWAKACGTHQKDPSKAQQEDHTKVDDPEQHLRTLQRTTEGSLTAPKRTSNRQGKQQSGGTSNPLCCPPR